jgi:hypothetical protein
LIRGLDNVAVSYAMVIFAPATPLKPEPCRSKTPLPLDEIDTYAALKANDAYERINAVTTSDNTSFLTNCTVCLHVASSPRITADQGD